MRIQKMVFLKRRKRASSIASSKKRKPTGKGSNWSQNTRIDTVTKGGSKLWKDNWKWKMSRLLFSRRSFRIRTRSTRSAASSSASCPRYSKRTTLRIKWPGRKVRLRRGSKMSLVELSIIIGRLRRLWASNTKNWSRENPTPWWKNRNLVKFTKLAYSLSCKSRIRSI